MAPYGQGPGGIIEARSRKPRERRGLHEAKHDHIPESSSADASIREAIDFLRQQAPRMIPRSTGGKVWTSFCA